jgi:2-haloacid dehalogenase
MTSSKSPTSSAASAVKLTDFDVLTFDCYGTLIDWESGMIEALKPLSSKASRALMRDEILEAHARHESAQQIQTPTKLYRDLLATVYRRLAEEWRVATGWSDSIAYGRSIQNWPAFADTALWRE